jgi:hypothetical protein
LLNLCDADNYQHDMFSQSEDNPELMRIMDGINQKYGRGTVHLAGQEIEHKFAMSRDFYHLSTPRAGVTYRVCIAFNWLYLKVNSIDKGVNPIRLKSTRFNMKAGAFVILATLLALIAIYLSTVIQLF